MIEPLLPIRVAVGGNYWAAWGDTGWSAVRIVRVQRKWAIAQRVRPTTNEVTTKRAKVSLTELMKRDPKLKGRDKPDVPPFVIFEAETRVVAPPPPPPPSAATPTPVARSRPPITQEVVEAVYGTWEEIDGKSRSTWPTTFNW